MTLRFTLPMSRLLAGTALFLAAIGPLPAWKVITHAHLAFIARADALDDGKVAIFLVDPDTGHLVLNAAGKPVEIGRYEVDPRILRVLSDLPEYFRAGAIGADVLPDMLTAQTIVHPDNRAIGRTTSDEGRTIFRSWAVEKERIDIHPLPSRGSRTSRMLWRGTPTSWP